MKIEEIELSQVRKKLVIDIGADAVHDEYGKVTEEFHRQAVIPGFRKGRVPRELIQQRFKESIEKETSERLVKSSLPAAFEEKSLKPVGNPEITNLKPDYPNSFHYEVELEVLPKFQVENYRKILLKRVLLPVTDEDVDARLQELRKNAAEFRSIDAEATEWNAVVADLKAEIEGTHTPILDQKAVLLTLGPDSEAPKIAAQLIGLKAGDIKDFSITYAEDDQPQGLAGKTVAYHARVAEVKERILPALDDDFATTLGDYSSLDELKGRVRMDQEAERDKEVRRKYAGQIMDYLSTAYPMEVPSAFYQDHALQNTVAYKQYLERSGKPIENLEEEMKKAFSHFADEAASFARISLVLEEIARSESIKVEDEEIDARIRQMAEESHKSFEALKAKIGENGVAQLRGNLLKDKVIDFLIAEATID